MEYLSVRAKSNTQASIINKILEERDRQDKKFGETPRNLHASVWQVVIQEELGEVSRAILDSKSDNYREELIQVAACAIAALEDYYLGTQRLSLEDVGCGIKYISEQKAT